MALNPLQSLQTPSSPSASGVSVSVPINVSNPVNSSARSTLDSYGSTYQQSSGSFTVGGGGNNLALILGGVALGIFFIMRKFK